MEFCDFKPYIHYIEKAIEDCEDIQNSDESEYKKMQAKISAYEEIKFLLVKEEK